MTDKLFDVTFLKEFSSKSINQYRNDLVQWKAVKNWDVKDLAKFC